MPTGTRPTAGRAVSRIFDALRRIAADVRIHVSEATLEGVNESSRIRLLLGESLAELERIEPRAAKVVKLHYLYGYTAKEVAEELGVSLATVRRDLTFARSFLLQRIEHSVDGIRDGDSTAVATAQSSGQATTADPADVGKGRQTDGTVMAHAFETFGSPEKADHWLHRPNHIFQGRTPLEVIESNPQAVEIELTRIDHGVFI